jgi:hypothetical protein
MDGLILKMFLREPRYAIKNGQITSTTHTTDYVITVPRLVTSLRTPSQEVRSQYLQLYSEGNLNYVFPSYHHIGRQESGQASANIELDLPIAKSSVRRVVFTCQDVFARGNVSDINLQYSTRGTSSKRYIDGRMDSYQFTVGGVDYPPLAVDVSDRLQTEAQMELMRAFNLHGNVNSQLRTKAMFIKNKFAFKRGVYDQSDKSIYATTFSTLENDPMSGLKTKGAGTDNHIIVKIDLEDNLEYVDAADNPIASSRYFDFWFEYTKILHVSADGIQALD